MSTVRLVTLGLTLLVALPAASGVVLEQPTQTIDLQGMWLFHADDNPAFAQPLLDDYAWTQVRVPTQHLPRTLRFAGYGWFRHHLEVAAEATQQEFQLILGQARYAIEVFVNGRRVGGRGIFGSRVRGADAITNLRVNLPAGTLRAGDNVIALRIFDPSLDSGLPGGPIKLEPASAALSLSIGHPARLLRLALASAAIFLTFALLVGHLGRREGGEFWWLFGAALSFAPWILSGTGVLESLLPDLELGLRISDVAGVLTLLFLATYFVLRFGNPHPAAVPSLRAVLGGWAAILLLLPTSWAYVAHGPALWVTSLMATLYISSLAMNSVRRREPLTRPLFGIMLLTFAALLYDGLSTRAFSVYPNASQLVVFFGITATVVLLTRYASAERERILALMLESRQRLAEGFSLAPLDAAALALGYPAEFLEQVVHQVAGDLRARRCSIILADDHGALKIRASVGLPRHAVLSSIDPKNSIAGHAYHKGERVTTEALPELLSRTGRGKYVTNAFISQPILALRGVLGVINVSDRNDGGDFTEEDEERLEVLSTRIATVLDRYGDLAAPFREVDEASREVTVLEGSALIQEFEESLKATPLSEEPA